MNKMDDFLNKRLSDFSAAEDGWNVPSDQVWENAKEHLPKPKKRKRKFIFFILLGLLLMTLGYSTGIFTTSSKTSTNMAQNLNHTSKNTSNVISNAEHDITNQSTISSGDEPNEILNDISTTSNSTATKFSEEAIVNTSSTHVKQNDKPLTGKISILNISPSQVIKTQTPTIPIIRTGTSDLNDSSVDLSLMGKTVDFETSVESDDSPFGHSTTSLTFLSLLPIDPLALNNAALLNSTFIPSAAPLNKVIKIFDTERKTQEVGISHSLSAFTFLKNQTAMEDLDRFTIRVNYFNFNLEYSKWITNRWKFSTGALLSKIDIDLDFNQFFNYEQTLMNQSIATEYGNTVEKSSANNAGNVRVTFIPGLEPAEGELINLRGSVNISMRALQVPLFLNYHRRKSKFEYFIGGGIALELIQERQQNAVIDVFREDQIISSSAEVDDLNEIRPDYSIYGTTGIRYHLTDKINTGLNLKVNISDYIFSSLDVGLYYRW